MLIPLRELTTEEPAETRASWSVSALLWWGLGVLAVGVGPLLLFCLACDLGLLRDKHPNPVGLGILAFLTFWPGVGLTIAGIITTACRYLAAQRSRDQVPRA